ncbi:MAG TPA: UbiA family prenyltransferase [Thermoanaerobaculia bacterium]|nr:UbiA family prenyltransferase [Thermoanaerobaculia bacterium]
MNDALRVPRSVFLVRFGRYLNERFPPIANVLLILVYYSSNQFLSFALTQPGTVAHYDRWSFLGMVMLVCFFFHIRVFDEHKDYEDDCKHYPQRVLQRGDITLRHLKIAGAIAIATEVALAALRGPAALTAWAIAFAFSLLMLKEFFAPHFLKRYFILYATSHMLIMPLLALTVFSFATLRWPWEAPPWFWVYAFVGFFVTFNWEVSRKIRAPEQEIDGVDSYTKIFGTFGAAYVVLAIRAIDTALVAAVGWHLRFANWFYAALVLLYAVCLFGFVQYRTRPTPRHAKMMEIYAGMYMIVFDFLVALSLWLKK